MIVDLEKVCIYGVKEEIDRFFAKAQQKGFLEFITPTQKGRQGSFAIQYLVSAIKILRRWEELEPSSHLLEGKDHTAFAEQIVKKNGELESLCEQRRVLRSEISRVAPFGDFSLDDVETIQRDGKKSLQFFCRKSSLAAQPVQPELIYVTTEYELDYFVAIQQERKQYPRFIEILIPKPVGILRLEMQDVLKKIALCENELRSAVSALPVLQKALIHALEQDSLETVVNSARASSDQGIFVLEAWVPKNHLQKLDRLLSQFLVHYEPIAIKPGELVPTCMENQGMGRLGQDLVEIYDTPSHHDKDPSSWIFIFFSIFFAMIVSDAGYGLIYLALALFLKWKIPVLKGALKRFVKLTTAVGITCILWGVFTASFFGIEIGPHNPFRKMSVLHFLATKKAEYHIEKQDDVYESYVKQFPQVAQAKDGHEFLTKAVHIREGKEKFEALSAFYDNLLLEFSLLMGIFHLSLSFLRQIRTNLAGLGWIAFMIGGYLFFPSVLNATSILHFMGWMPKEIAFFIGKPILFGGIAWAVLVTVWKRGILMGLHEGLNAIQVFSDVLSYLRLYALGLAGMIVATTFNDISSYFPWMIGIFILLIGHATNLTLSTMGGVIHGLRLNFLEWYHYSFEGGGRLFNPLRLFGERK